MCECFVDVCSNDFGKTLTQVKLPHNSPVESLTASMIGLWVAIHVVNPKKSQHEVHSSSLCLLFCNSSNTIQYNTIQ